MDYQLLSKLYYQDKQQYDNLFRQRYESENTLHFDFKVHEHEAFCVLNAQIFKLCADIAALDKRVGKTIIQLPRIAMNQFVTKSLIDEIILSNNMEGVYSTRKEINYILNDVKHKSKQKRFYGMVMKYKMLGEDQLSLGTCEDVRNIYDELVLPEVIQADIHNKPDGIIFRKEMAEVTTSAQKIIHQGVYPEEKIIEALEKALRILNNEEIPLLIRVAAFHYFFGYIHPFYDGNGRTSRFISSYLLTQAFEPIIGCRLSYTIQMNIHQYYEAFKVCNDTKNKGDITPFILMFLKVIKESFENLYQALLVRLKNLEKYEGIIDSIHSIDRETAKVLLQATLFSKQGAIKRDLCNALEISETTLRNRLKKIEQAGYLIVQKNTKTYYYSLNLSALEQK